MGGRCAISSIYRVIYILAVLAAAVAGIFVMWVGSRNSFYPVFSPHGAVDYEDSVLAHMMPLFLVIAAAPVIALVFPLFLRRERRLFASGCVVAGLFVAVGATFLLGGMVYLPVALLALASLMGDVTASRALLEPGVVARVAVAAMIGACFWLVGALMASVQGVWPPAVPRVVPLDAAFVFSTLLFGWCAYHLYRAKAVDSLAGRLCFGIGTAGSYVALSIPAHHFATDRSTALGWPPNPPTMMLIVIASMLLIAPLLVPRRGTQQ